MALEVDVKVVDMASDKIEAIANKTGRAVEGFGRISEETTARSKVSWSNLAIAVTGVNQALELSKKVIGTVSQVYNSVISQTITYGEKLNELSEATNVSVETLQAFQWAARRTGETNESVASAVTRLARTVKELSEGNENTIRTFQNLGVQWRNADGTLRTLDEILIDVARQLSLVNNITDKTSYALDIFGRSGTEFINTLDMLGKEYSQITDRMKLFGHYISPEKAKQMDEYRDRVQDLKDAFNGIKITISQAVLPALTNFANKIYELVTGYALYVQLVKDPDYLKRQELQAELLSKQAKTIKELVEAGKAQLALELFGKKMEIRKMPAPYSEGRKIGEEEKEKEEKKEEMKAPLLEGEFRGPLAGTKFKYPHELEIYTKLLEDMAKSGEKANKILEEGYEIKLKDDEEIQNRYELMLQNNELEKERIKLTKEYSYEAANALMQSMTDIAYAFSQKSEQAFEAYKAAQIAETIVSTYTSAQLAFQRALELPIGPAAYVIGAALAAATIASGLARVKMISSQSFAEGGILLTGPQVPWSSERVFLGTPGEGIVNKRAMQELGPDWLYDINRGRYKKEKPINIVINTTATIDENFVRNKLVPMLRRVERK